MHLNDAFAKLSSQLPHADFLKHIRIDEDKVAPHDLEYFAETVVLQLNLLDTAPVGAFAITSRLAAIGKEAMRRASGVWREFVGLLASERVNQPAIAGYPSGGTGDTDRGAEGPVPQKESKPDELTGVDYQSIAAKAVLDYPKELIANPNAQEELSEVLKFLAVRLQPVTPTAPRERDAPETEKAIATGTSVARNTTAAFVGGNHIHNHNHNHNHYSNHLHLHMSPEGEKKFWQYVGRIASILAIAQVLGLTPTAVAPGDLPDPEPPRPAVEAVETEVDNVDDTVPVVASEEASAGPSVPLAREWQVFMVNTRESNLNVRSEPADGAQILAKLPKGTLVLVKAGSEGRFVAVRYGDGKCDLQDGFAAREYLLQMEP